jgi:hypothetical protein
MQGSRKEVECPIQNHKYDVRWSSVLLLTLIWRVTYVGGMGPMSPRVVHTKQTQYQGFLGPGNVQTRSGYGSNGSYSFPYNYRGFGQGHPVIEVRNTTFISHMRFGRQID